MSGSGGGGVGEGHTPHCCNHPIHCLFFPQVLSYNSPSPAESCTLTPLSTALPHALQLCFTLLELYFTLYDFTSLYTALLQSIRLYFTLYGFNSLYTPLLHSIRL